MQRVHAHPLPAAAAVCALALTGGCTDYGYHEYEQVDVYEQRAAEMVDILLIVDDSASMAPYQQQLGENLPSFLVWLLEAGVDYRIGVITTDVFTSTAGHISDQVVTVDTDDAESVFSELVEVGVAGSGAEMGLEAAWMALVDPEITPENDHFLRESAVLSLVFLTDENDLSPLSTPDYVDAFRGVKGNDRQAVNASAMVVVDRESCDETLSADSANGTRYVDVADLTKGAVADLCATDFGAIVEDVSLNISRLEDVFYLTGLPDPRSLEIEIDDAPIACDAGIWTYAVGELQGEETGTIVFTEDTMPGVGSKIAVRYNFGTGDPALFCQDEASE